MKTIPLADFEARLSAYLDEARKEGPIVITRSGRPVAVLIAPLDDDDLESLILSRSPRFRAMLEKSRHSVKFGRGIASKDFWGAVEGEIGPDETE